MDDVQRDALIRRNQTRSITCRKCGAIGQLRERDGSEVGGMPGLRYKECGGCGNSQPITQRGKRRHRWT